MAGIPSERRNASLSRLRFKPNNPFGNAAQRRWHGNGGCLPRKHAGLCTDMQLFPWVQ